MAYRFSTRPAQLEVWGCTSLTHRFIFIFNQVQENGKPGLLGRKVWVHELFHALSMHYGIFRVARRNGRQARAGGRKLRQEVRDRCVGKVREGGSEWSRRS